MSGKNALNNPVAGFLGRPSGIYSAFIAFVAVIGVVLSVVLFMAARNWDQRQLQVRFDRASEDRILALQRGIEENLQELESINAFYTASRDVSPKTFRDFVKPFLQNNPGIQSFYWAPRVPLARRIAFEAAARKDGLAEFQITEQNPHGVTAKAAARREYFPVFFVEPYAINTASVGFDLASEPARLAAMEQARDTGVMTVTPRIPLVQGAGSQFGFLAFQPVYRNESGNDTAGARRKYLIGFAVGVFRISDMMEKSLSYLKHQDIDVRVYDTTAPRGSQFLYSYPEAHRSLASFPDINEDRTSLEQGLYHVRTIGVADRQWTFLCLPSPRYLHERRTWLPWEVLGGGLACTGLLIVFVIAIFIRAEKTRQFAELIIRSKADLEREAAVRSQAEQTLRSLFENMLEGFAYCRMIFDGDRPQDFVYLDVNAAFEKLTGLKDVIGKKVSEVIPGIREGHPELFEIYGRVALTGKPERFEVHSELFGGWLAVSVYSVERGYFVAVFDNVTERKQRERQLEAISSLSMALRSASTRAHQVPIILDHVLGLLSVDAASLAMLDPVTCETVVEGARGVWESWTGLRFPCDAGVMGRCIAASQTYASDDISGDPLLTRTETIDDLRSLVCVPLIAEKKTIGAIMIGRRTRIRKEDAQLLHAIGEIAAISIHRLSLHAQTVRQMQHLFALHEIDAAISSSLDLRVTMNVLLGHVIKELGVDAAAVLLLSPHTQTLGYVAGRGFRTRDIERAKVKLGEGCAGKAALERKRVSVFNTSDTHEKCPHLQMLAGEDFVSHHVVPLIVKAQVKGVLEVCNRSPLVPDQEWFDFFEALAGQASIAIENAALINDLQRANDELVLAYDATIEGWSKALDLRDKETEGHSLRVTELTVTIARAMGISEADIVHMRRGALLHDIGKMGVPDGILFKPGRLSEEEWVIMRKHPVFSHELLSPITFLRPALDIPYCHHEKWDGTGYPRQLKGEQIPLAARIFAVVDVWDALSSDRPYRPAWPKEKVLQYLRDQTEKDFDPAVVEMFVALLVAEQPVSS